MQTSCYASKILTASMCCLVFSCNHFFFYSTRTNCSYESVASSSSANSQAFLITASCSSEKKVLLFYQTSSDSKIQLRGVVVLHVVMTGVNTLPVEVPLPRRCRLHIIRSDFSCFAQKSLFIHFVAAPLTAAIALLDCGGAFGK